MTQQKLIKYLMIGLGSICLALGTIGILIPVLPTTPFLLLASFFYLRSSEKLHQWMIHHKVFGPYLYNYLTHRVVPARAKVIALVTLWASLSFAMTLIPLIAVRIGVGAIGLAVTIYILSLKSVPSVQQED